MSIPSASSAQPTPRPVFREELEAIASGVHQDPHRILGAHLDQGVVTVRVLRPLADAVVVVTGSGEVVAEHEHHGVWVAVLPGDEVPDYRLRVTYGSVTSDTDDPYRFLPTLGEMDLHLIAEGRHEELWTVLGANVRTYPGALGEVRGTSFAVWAPNARAVRVVGDFNHWQGSAHAMRALGTSGVWELFVPGVGAGARYKYEVLTADGSWRQKADPMAKGTEVPPATASVVVESDYTWQDDAWLTQRSATDPHHRPISIYEVHLGSWRPGLGYRELADQLTEYVASLGFTHVELLPVAEHPFGGSWGYQVSSYYAPTARFGSPDEFRHLVDRLHQAGIGVILDWVPAHFPKDEWALGRFDGTPLYEHPDPLLGEQPDWGTYVFNFGRNEVRNFLVANATYWLEEFHLDGLRVDAVASMLYLDYSRSHGQWRPNIHGGRENLEAIRFIQEANATAYRRTPGILMIAEESTAWPGVTAPTDAGGLGFGLKWNMGWMNDTLRYLAEEPINRRYHHHEVTFSLVYAFSEHFVLPLSHDEVVHGKGSLLAKMPGDEWLETAGLRTLLAYQWSHPGKQLLFMGSEFGQSSEWNEGAGLDWHLLQYDRHQGVSRLVTDLNRLYRREPALWALDADPAGYEWIDGQDADHNVLSYIRRDGTGREVVVVVNFAGTAHEDYHLGLPHGGTWLEVLNTDSEVYGGSGVGNMGRVEAVAQHRHGQSHSVRLRVPPMGVLFLVPEGQEPVDAAVTTSAARPTTGGSAPGTEPGATASTAEAPAPATAAAPEPAPAPAPDSTPGPPPAPTTPEPLVDPLPTPGPGPSRDALPDADRGLER
ncbi:1,4-alpha-glucan branching protein GlgB [Actinotalea sp. AC32]|nr:1,4-alpha-glucan branching protein GlgB [Actinotalea sp. AC32]